jgi:hypothetical protein
MYCLRLQCINELSDMYWMCIYSKIHVSTTTYMRRLTSGIRSEKYVVRRFRRCVNVYLHKPRQYSLSYYTPRLYGLAYCSLTTNLYNTLP